MTDQRVLVIDDEPDFAIFVRRVGEGLGCNVIVAPNADEFKKLYASFNPTIIVLDIIMPDTDGLELVRWLADNGARAKIVTVSGFNPIYGSLATRIGAIHGLSLTSLSKPVALDDLRKVLS